MFKAINLKKLFMSIVWMELIGLMSWLVSKSGISAYSGLIKPDYAPPEYIFNFAWIVIYFFMGTAWYFEKSSSMPKHAKSSSSLWFVMQLLFSFAWPIIFFNLKLYGFASLWLIALVLLTGITIKCFRRVSKGSAYIMVIPIVWHVYVLYLNYGIWMLNK